MTRACSFSSGTPSSLGDGGDLLLLVRQELVQRRIEQADRHRQPGHDLEQLPRNRRAAWAASWRARARRPASSSAQIISRMARMRLVLEEHVLGAAQADALGAELARLARLARGVGVGAHAERRAASAQPMIVAKSPDSSGWRIFTRPSSTSPVPPSMVMTSPLRKTLRRRPAWCRPWRRCAARRRRTRTAGPCRAPPRRRGWSCRRAR